MSLADDGAHSVMSCVNELSPFADYSRPIAYVGLDGFTLARRFETAGWMRRGERQSLGDLWLSFRDGTAEEHLRPGDSMDHGFAASAAWLIFRALQEKGRR